MSSNMDMASSLFLTAGILNLNGYSIINPSNDIFCTGTCIIKGTGSISCYGYNQVSGTPDLSFVGSPTLIVGVGNFEMSTGSFNGGSSKLDINNYFQLTGGTFNSTSDTMFVSSNFQHTTSGTFNHNFGTVVFDGASNTLLTMINSKETFYNVVINKSSNSYIVYEYYTGDTMQVLNNAYFLRGNLNSWNSWAVTMAIKGDLKVYSTFGTSSYYNEILFNGSNDQNVDLTGATNKLDGRFSMNKTTGSLFLLSDLNLDGNGSITGDLRLGNGRLNLNGFNLNHNISSTQVLGRATIVGPGSFTTFNFNHSGSDTLDFDGTPITVTINNDLTVSSGVFICDSTILDINRQFVQSGGYFSAPRTSMFVASAWNHSSGGTFSHNGGTVIFDGGSSWQGYNFMKTEVFFNVTMNKSSCYYEKIMEGDTMIVEGDLNLMSGYFWSRNNEVNGVPNIIKVKGNIKISNDYCESGSYPPTLILICGNDQNIDASGAIGDYNGKIIINKTGGTVTLLSNLTIDANGQTFTIGNGTLNLNGYTLTLGGSNILYRYSGVNLIYNGGSISGGTIDTMGTSYPVDPNSCLTPVPIELLWFKVLPTLIGNKITWSTATELNNSHFELFRNTSKNSEMKKIGTIQGAGNSLTKLNYSWLDEEKIQGVICYQLKQVDFNGHESYFDVQCVEVLNKNDVNVYPNPADAFVTINIKMPTSMEKSVCITDISGRKLISQDLESKDSEVTIDLTNILTDGIYFIQVSSGTSNWVQKLQVKH